MPDWIRREGSRAWRAQWPVYCEILLCAVLDLLYETIRALIAPDTSAVRTAVANAHDVLRLEAHLGLDIEAWSQRVTDAVAGGRFVTTWYYTLAYIAAVHRLPAVDLVLAPGQLRVRAQLVLDGARDRADRLLGLSAGPAAPGRGRPRRHHQARADPRRGARLVPAPAQRATRRCPRCTSANRSCTR